MSNSFPLELYFKILEEVSCDLGRSVDSTSLSASSQVCSTWSEFCQKLLFRSINLGHWHAQSGLTRYQLLIAQINPSTDRGAILGSYVCELDVALGVSSSPQYGLRQDQFMRLISFCPRLCHLTLRSTIAKFDPSFTTRLKDIVSVGSGQMRSLTLAKCVPHFPVIYQLVSIWPSIQRLRINCLVSPRETPPSPPMIQLRELVLVRGEQLPRRLLDWLLSGSETSLEILELHDEPGPQIKGVLSEHGQHVRSLSMPCYNRMSAEAARLCPRLEELKMVFYQKAVLAHLHDLPSTIRHFAFQSVAQKSLHHSILKAVGTLPNLQSVTCHQNPERHAFLALQGVCKINRITLKIDSRSLLQMD